MNKSCFFLGLTLISSALTSCISVPGPVTPFPGGSGYYGNNYGYNQNYYNNNDRERIFQNGHNDGLRDKRDGKTYQPTRHDDNIPGNMRDEYYRGYKVGYFSTGGGHGSGHSNDSINQNAAYNTGFQLGRQDRNANRAANPARYKNRYNSNTQADFNRGYFAGFR